MDVSFGTMPRDVKSPVRASDLTTNWISLSFFKQTTYRKRLPEALGCK
ncbi:hypothetical protein SOV_32120 [Sporomusa ovata DSM 2662]|nr:hypothetical protein [Sporomusa ovata]EQB25167.1 hypothetical protein SOV_5c03170 [Sporomusa ovata DSM 2662]